MADGNPKPRCFLCGRNHPLKYCLRFRKMLFSERRQALEGQDICLNCFGHGHTRSACPSVNRCERCKAKHHSMIHRDRIEHDSSRENVVEESDHQNDVPTTHTAIFDVVPFHKQLTTYEGAKQVGWISPEGMNNAIEPVMECKLSAGNQTKLLTFHLCERVPKSWVLYDSVNEFKVIKPTASTLSYCSFTIHGPELIDERFVLLETSPFYIAPPINRPDLIIYAEGRKLAHPEPFTYKTIDGVIGRDLVEAVVRGPWVKSERNPNVLLRETIFGLVFGGSCARSNIPFLKTLCPLIPKENYSA